MKGTAVIIVIILVILEKIGSDDSSVQRLFAH